MTCTRGNGRRAAFRRRNWFSVRTPVYTSRGRWKSSPLPTPPEDEVDMTCDATSTNVFRFASWRSSKTVGPKTVSYGQKTNHGDRWFIFAFSRSNTKRYNERTNLRATVFSFSSALSRPNSANEKLAQRHPPERDDLTWDFRFSRSSLFVPFTWVAKTIFANYWSEPCVVGFFWNLIKEKTGYSSMFDKKKKQNA